MMSKLLKIAVSLVIIFVIAAPSCDEESTATAEQEIFEMRKDVIEEFSSDYLSESEKFAFEQKAVQLLAEVFDYLNVVMDSTIDRDFRQPSAKMLKQSFTSGHVTFNIDGSDDELLTVDKLIINGLNNNFNHPNFKVRKVRIESPLQKSDEDEYSGKIMFYISKWKGKLTANFFVVKELKKFGNETILVWQVKLGEIFPHQFQGE